MLFFDFIDLKFSVKIVLDNLKKINFHRLFIRYFSREFRLTKNTELVLQ